MKLKLAASQWRAGVGHHPVQCAAGDGDSGGDRRPGRYRPRPLLCLTLTPPLCLTLTPPLLCLSGVLEKDTILSSVQLETATAAVTGVPAVTDLVPFSVSPSPHPSVSPSPRPSSVSVACWRRTSSCPTCSWRRRQRRWPASRPSPTSRPPSSNSSRPAASPPPRRYSRHAPRTWSRTTTDLQRSSVRWPTARGVQLCYNAIVENCHTILTF